MGICLDTEREQNGSQEFEVQGRDAWFSDNEGNFRYPNTPPEGLFPMQNDGHVKFEVPKVPVIFVLGGPGSGKVTHCDTLMQEKRGITHINMTDLLQQYTVGNADMKDFNQLSSRTVTEVLMLEMKMAPAAKTYLVSGYPRNMRDVVEYSNKIQIVNGVILIAWREKVLERQIDYGAKLGQVVLSLAKMELGNFYKNVMPVGDYFDQRGMLMAVNGERNPGDVYNDFRSAVLRILGANSDKGNGMSNGVAVHPTPTTAVSVYKPPTKGYPPVIWVIGGPGSNKSSLCQKAIRQTTGWIHLSVGRLLRTAAEVTDQSQANDARQIKEAISAGEMVDQNVVLQLVETQILTNMNAQGILIDGFPRDVTQVHKFEEKFKQQPTVILLDCSKLQLGRGRLDDSIAAFRRRLELFRELTLPMLKTLDSENRLSIVDGDTDTPPVQEEFSKIIQQQIEHLKKIDGMIVPDQHHMTGNGVVSNGNGVLLDDTQIHDLETEDDDTPVRPVYMNGYGPPGVSHIGRTVAAYHQTNEVNGGLFGGPTITDSRPSRDTIQNMYAQVDRYPLDSNI